MYSTANLSDRELKEQGNRLFSLRKYEDAINCYTKAIVSRITILSLPQNQNLLRFHFRSRILILLIISQIGLYAIWNYWNGIKHVQTAEGPLIWTQIWWKVTSFWGRLCLKLITMMKQLNICKGVRKFNFQV